MTVIDQIRDEISDSGGKLMWSGALVTALGDPKEWEYRGETGEGDPSKTHCSCGHPIADIYYIHHKVTGRMAMLGSTCIGYFEHAGDIYADLCAAVKAQEKKLAEARKTAKKAADEIKVTEARTSFEAAHSGMKSCFRGYRERGQMAPRELWAACESNYYRIPLHCPDYQRACDYLKWYARQIKAIDIAMGRKAEPLTKE